MSAIDDGPMHGVSKAEKKKLANDKLVKSFDQSVYGQILYQIPRHLLKLTILVVVGSFLGMFYIINSDKTLNEFIYSEEIYDFTENKVHPLFHHMQRVMDPDVKEMVKRVQDDQAKVVVPQHFVERMEGKVSYDYYKEMKGMRGKTKKVLIDFIPGLAEQANVDEITTKKMYQQHIARNKPLVVKNGSKSWPAFEKW